MLQLHVQLIPHCFQVSWTIYRINHFKYLSFTKMTIATVVLLNNGNATDCSVAVKAEVGEGCVWQNRIETGVSCCMRFEMELQSD